MDTQAFKGELGTMRDVLGEIQSDMYKSMEKNKPVAVCGSVEERHGIVLAKNYAAKESSLVLLHHMAI